MRLTGNHAKHVSKSMGTGRVVDESDYGMPTWAVVGNDRGDDGLTSSLANVVVRPDEDPDIMLAVRGVTTSDSLGGNVVFSGNTTMSLTLAGATELIHDLGEAVAHARRLRKDSVADYTRGPKEGP